MMNAEMLDKLDSRATIEIVSVLFAEPDMLRACLAKIVQYYEQIDSARIVCCAREASGWLEYLLVLHFRSGGSLTLGAIQRTEDSEVEFHS